MKATLLVWKQHYDHKCELKNRKADKFYNAMVTRRFLALWKKVSSYDISVFTDCPDIILVCERNEVLQLSH